MPIVHQRIARAVPEVGFDVHVYDYGSTGGVILMKDAQIAWQTYPDSFDEAKRIGFDLMALHDCEMVEHHPYENRSEA